MKFFLCSLLFASQLALSTVAHKKTSEPLEKVNLTAPDNSIKASFISYGATSTNLWVKDREGNFRDVLIGFDNLTNYVTDALGHPYLGIVGRYANRIRNGTFTIPISKDASGPGEKFQVPNNEHNGTNSLHGGLIGYDRRTWSIKDKSDSSVTFTLVDPDGEQGFPGTTNTTVTYCLKENSTWDISIDAVADKETPILLSSHNYFNLEAYVESQDLEGHFAQFKSSKIIATDGLLIPNGSFVETEGTALDFNEAKSIGQAIPETAEFEYCGTGCVGFDNCWIYDDNEGSEPAVSFWSENSGIRLDVTTDQVALQIYTCNGIFNASNPIPRKASQGDGFYENHSCMVIEQEDYIDAINNPEYGRDQIYGPDRAYKWTASYAFSVQE